LGGEPALHPQFFEIIDILKIYKDHNPKCYIVLITNGFGPQVKEVISKLPDWVTINNSKKESNTNVFSSFNIAPIDLAAYKNADFARGCSNLQRCGIGLSRYGYYPCGPGASIDRVLGFNIGIKKLPQLTDRRLKAQLKILCPYCGHFKDDYDSEKITDEKISFSWHKAYEKYKKKKPKLSRY
jgi:hypothetical protein